MDNADEAWEVGFDRVDATRIRLAAARLGLTPEEYIRMAVEKAIEERLEGWLGEGKKEDE